MKLISNEKLLIHKQMEFSINIYSKNNILGNPPFLTPIVNCSRNTIDLFVQMFDLWTPIKEQTLKMQQYT